MVYLQNKPNLLLLGELVFIRVIRGEFCRTKPIETDFRTDHNANGL